MAGVPPPRGEHAVRLLRWLEAAALGRKRASEQAGRASSASLYSAHFLPIHEARGNETTAAMRRARGTTRSNALRPVRPERTRNVSVFSSAKMLKIQVREESDPAARQTRPIYV